MLIKFGSEVFRGRNLFGDLTLISRSECVSYFLLTGRIVLPGERAISASFEMV